MKNEEFLARIARIQAGQGNTNATVFVGMHESFVYNRPVQRKVTRAGEIRGNTAYPLSILCAFLLGLFGVAFGRYVRFQMMQTAIPDADPTMDWLVNGAIGLMIAFALSQVFRLRAKEYLGVQLLGVFVMMCTFHDLVHLMPDQFEKAFSQDWVQMMLTTTEPNSVLFRGMFYML